MPEPTVTQNEPDLLLLDKQLLPRFAVFQRCKYKMSHVNNPANFYLIRDSHIFQRIKEAIKLCKDHTFRPNRKADLDRVNVIGELCLAPIENGLYERAMIKAIVKDCDQMSITRVIFIDSGREEWVMSKDRRFLENPRFKFDANQYLTPYDKEKICESMLFLRFCPAQAVKCQLDGIERFCGHDYYSESDVIGGEKNHIPGCDLIGEEKNHSSGSDLIGGEKTYSTAATDLFKDITEGKTLIINWVEPNDVDVRRYQLDANFDLGSVVFKVKMDILEDVNKKQKDVLAVLRAKYKRSDVCIPRKDVVNGTGDSFPLSDDLRPTQAALQHIKRHKIEWEEESEVELVENAQEMLHPSFSEYITETGGIHIWVSDKVSPDEFYVHPIAAPRGWGNNRLTCAMALQSLNLELDGRQSLQHLAHDMDQFYFNPQNRQRLLQRQIKTLWDSGKRVYAATLRGVGTPHCGSEWRRVEVTKPTQNEDSFVRVHYIDWGGSDIKDYKDIYRLDNSLHSTPAQAWKCTISDDGVDETPQKWSDNCLRAFKYYLRTDVPLLAYCSGNTPDTTKAFTVHLIDVNIPSDEEEGDLSIRGLISKCIL